MDSNSKFYTELQELVNKYFLSEVQDGAMTGAEFSELCEKWQFSVKFLVNFLDKKRPTIESYKFRPEYTIPPAVAVKMRQLDFMLGKLKIN